MRGCVKALRKLIIEATCFLLLCGILIYSAFGNPGHYAFLSFGAILLSLVPFYASFERRRPQARELVPIAVLAAAGAAGRALFAAFPSVKPTSAIVIVSGIVFGPEAGFMTGATSALVSNFFFGQGPFTPWQMFGWGMMGFTAGLLFRKREKVNVPAICVFGFIWGFLFGWFMDIWQALGFLSPVTFKGFLLTFAASFYFDLTHAVSNAVFLLLIAKRWVKILSRVKVKYGLME